jgi:phage/plasmid-like protein (TIGR03299 family)
MAHNLASDRNGRPMFASFRQGAWHQLGTVFQEAVTGDEMLRIAGLDYMVRHADLTAPVLVEGTADNFDGMDEMGRPFIRQTSTVQGLKAVYRGDTGDILGVTSDKYEIFQNKEMVALLDEMAGAGQIVYETAGGLGKGEKVWVLANIPDLDFNVKDDAIRQYMLVTTAHDGSAALQIFPTAIRVVCQNTMRMATQARKDREVASGKNNITAGYSVKHTAKMRDMVAQVVDAYKATIDANRFSRELYAALAETPSTKEMKDEFFGFIVDGGKVEANTAKAQTRRDGKRKELDNMLLLPTNNTEAAKGTAWGLLQAGIEFVDYFGGTRATGGKTTEQARFESAQFGAGADLKDTMLDKIVELAGV